MNIKKCFFLCLIGIAFIGASQLNAGWIKAYGTTGKETGYSVVQTYDKGYIIAGTTTPDSSGDKLLIKTDSLGNIIWEWSKKNKGLLAPNSSDVCYSVQQTYDSGYIITGYYYESNSIYGAFLTKTDVSGNVLWNKKFIGNTKGRSVQSASGGIDGYIIAGTSDNYAWLEKTDANGNEIWNKKLHRDSTTGFESYSVQQTSDKGYILAGMSQADSGNVLLIKTNALGDSLWTKTFGGVHPDIGYSVRQTFDGGYIIAGLTQSYSIDVCKGDVWLIKTDLSGNILWNKKFGWAKKDIGYSLQQTSDGGYIITGVYGYGGGDVWLIKTNASGDSLWTRTFGGTKYDVGYSLQQTSDGGYIIVGTTQSYDSTRKGVLLIKTDSLGRIGVEEADAGSKMQEPRLEIYPNPFCRKTSILYSLPANLADARIAIYDISGKLIHTLSVNPCHNQCQSVTWDAKDCTTGIYFVKLIAGDFKETRKLILMR